MGVGREPHRGAVAGEAATPPAAAGAGSSQSPRQRLRRRSSGSGDAARTTGDAPRHRRRRRPPGWYLIGGRGRRARGWGESLIKVRRRGQHCGSGRRRRCGSHSCSGVFSAKSEPAPARGDWAAADDHEAHAQRTGPIFVVKSTSAFSCFRANRKSANRPGALSRLVFPRKGAKIICSPASMILHS